LSRIKVLVASTPSDVKAAVIAAHIADNVAARPDMTRIGERFVAADTVESLLNSLPAEPSYAVILVGNPADTTDLAEQWLAKRPDLVVMLVDIDDDVVRIALRDRLLDSLLTALRGLVDRVGTPGQDRVVHVHFEPEAAVEHEPEPAAEPRCEPPAEAEPAPEADAVGEAAEIPPEQHPLLDASIVWLHTVLREAVHRVPVDNGDVHGLSVTRATLLQALDAPSERVLVDQPSDLMSAETALDAALNDAAAAEKESIEPLAKAVQSLHLTPVDFKLLLLALAPEIDFRYQRSIGFLLDEMGRRVGTFGLYAWLLGSNAQLREGLAESGSLEQWRIFDMSAGHRAPADEPLRIDPFLARWLLGEPGALSLDPRVRRVLRLEPWLGTVLLTRREERSTARQLYEALRHRHGPRFLVLNGEDHAGWRALFEMAAHEHHRSPIRVELGRLSAADIVDVEDVARLLGRLARLTRRPLIVDSVKAEASEGSDDWLRAFFGALAPSSRSAILCRDEARIVALIGATGFTLIGGEPLSRDARTEAVRAAASGAEAFITSDEAQTIATRFPLAVDGLEQAMHLAKSRPLQYGTRDPRLDRFTVACKELVVEGLSHLADRLEPIFDLDDVVLPPDRKSQLIEIVDNVRFAHQVLDEWKFGEHLPYGRATTALLYGPSGVGKSMAALAIAKRLNNLSVLRLDLSRVVSKYIGDTEKNIDRVFADAERSGAVLLIEEADALFSKRSSEIKDSHDRHAAIQIGFHLQRFENFRGGLAILTSNMKQSIDSAFMRRLRFMIEFPRPDADAREQIWRKCLPEGTHTLDDASFRLLGRRVDVNGGNIRLITLRAAFIAAAAGSLITLEHVARAARAELAKLGMPSVELDPTQGRRAA